MLCIGVLAHFFDRTKFAHYVLMPLGVIFILIGAIMARQRSAGNGKSLMKESDRDYHIILACIALVSMVLQILGGVYLNWLKSAEDDYADRNVIIRILHRDFGIGILIVLAVIFGDASRRVAPLTAYNHSTAIHWFGLVTCIGLALVAALATVNLFLILRAVVGNKTPLNNLLL